MRVLKSIVPEYQKRLTMQSLLSYSINSMKFSSFSPHRPLVIIRTYQVLVYSPAHLSTHTVVTSELRCLRYRMDQILTLAPEITS